ncbi:MAG TPA: hypothetical protein VGM89_09515, partial [Puia sp.]
MIKRLLILVLLCGGAGLTAMAQPLSAQPATTDTLPRIPGTFKRTVDTLPLSDQAKRARDSVLHLSDTVLSAAEMLRQIDSLNAAPGTPVDSVKLRLDAMLAAASQRTGGLPGQPNSPARQSVNPGYTPPAGSTPQVYLPGNHGAAHAPTAAPNGARPAAKSRNTPLSLSNLHRKYLAVKGGIIHIDSASLIPNAFFIKDVPDSAYTLDWVNATLAWRHPPPGDPDRVADSVLITYRSFPYRLNAIARRFSYDSIENYFLFHPNDRDKDARNGDNFFNFGNITYNGSFGRSITFGNSQDAVVTSNLNLQISGYLADSIEISAAITDNNIPIQPDGTTADLNEFDKIFL